MGAGALRPDRGNFFDLGEEKAGVAKENHIVGAAFDAGHANEGAAAGARGGIEGRNIAGAVANKGETFLGNSE